MVSPGNIVRQELFTARTPLGSELRLVLLADGRCGIMRDGELVKTSSADDGSMDEMVRQFLEMAEES